MTLWGGCGGAARGQGGVEGPKISLEPLRAGHAADRPQRPTARCLSGNERLCAWPGKRGVEGGKSGGRGVTPSDWRPAGGPRRRICTDPSTPMRTSCLVVVPGVPGPARVPPAVLPGGGRRVHGRQGGGVGGLGRARRAPPQRPARWAGGGAAVAVDIPDGLRLCRPLRVLRPRPREPGLRTGPAGRCATTPPSSRRRASPCA